MFKTRKQLKREISDLELLLSAAERRADSILKEAATINSKAEQERRELADTIQAQRNTIAELRRNCTDYNTRIKAKDAEIEEAKKELAQLREENQTLRSKLSRKHCNTVAKKWRKGAQTEKK